VEAAAIPAASPSDLARLRAARARPVDTSDIPESRPGSRPAARGPAGDRPLALRSRIREVILDELGRRQITRYELWRRAQAHCPTLSESAVYEFLRGQRQIGLRYVEALMVAIEVSVHRQDQPPAGPTSRLLELVARWPGLPVAPALEAVVRVLLARWPAGCVEDATTGVRYQTLGAIPFAAVRELRVFKRWPDDDPKWPQRQALQDSGNVVLCATARSLSIGINSAAEGDALVQDARGAVRGLPWMSPPERDSRRKVTRRAS
jgi:hypothetical protein